MSYSNETVQKVWEKAFIVPGYDPQVWRKDVCGAWIKRADYGNRGSLYGWEIDHITPVAKGGNDSLANLRPLQWENNASRQDGQLVCVVTAQGEANVKKGLR